MSSNEETQAKFDKLILLLQASAIGNIFVKELLEYYTHNEVSFAAPETRGVGKGHLLNIYEARAGLEDYLRPNNHFVLGYDSLLPALKNTDIEEVCISRVSSELGSYMIFSDCGFDRFVGMLKSQTTLSEIRDNLEAHKRQVEVFGGEIKYTIEEVSVFKKGKLIIDSP